MSQQRKVSQEIEPSSTKPQVGEPAAAPSVPEATLSAPATSPPVPATTPSVPAASHASGAERGTTETPQSDQPPKETPAATTPSQQAIGTSSTLGSPPAPQTYTYVIMKRSSEHESDPITQFTDADLDRYPFNEGLAYSRPHGRVFAVFHGQSPEAALNLFHEEVAAVEKYLEELKSGGDSYYDDYMKLLNIFVETDPVGKVEETGLVRAVLARRRKEGQEKPKREEGDNRPLYQEEEDEGQREQGMVFMWIERWGGAEMEEEGSRSGLMMSRNKRRPVGRAQQKTKKGVERVVKEYKEQIPLW